MNNVLEQVNLGKLASVMDQPDVRGISAGYGKIFVNSNIKGTHMLNEIISEKEINRIAMQVANRMGKEFNASFPFLEGEINCKNYIIRVSAFHEYVSPNGTTLTLRKVTLDNILSEKQMLAECFADQESIDRMIQYVKSGRNIIVIGETGSGKTQLVKWLSGFIPAEKRIITIEDSMEFQLSHLYPEKNVLEVRVRSNMTYSEVIAKCLRQDLQYLLLQEARGKEVQDLLDGMSNGCAVMTTMHANENIGITNRIMQMLQLSESEYASLDMRVHSLIDVVIEVRKKEKDGIFRFLNSIIEFSYQDNKPFEKVVWKNSEVIL